MPRKPNPNETKQQARKHARTIQAIGESEEWLFTTMESIGDAVIATDAQGQIVFMNTVAVQLTGWSEEEAQGRDCHEVFHIVNESTRLETESPVAKVIRDGVVSGLANHTILIARNGVEHYIDDSGSPIRDKAGSLTGVVLIFRDVTERRKSEQVLQEQQEILQTLFDYIPVIVTFLDANRKFKWVNREWTRVLGWSLEEMRDLKQFQAVSPALFNEVEVLSLEAPAPGWHDLTIAVKAGYLLNLSWSMVRLADGTSIGIGQNLTPRQNREAISGSQNREAITGTRLDEIQTHNVRLQQAMQETDHRVKNNLQSVAALLDIQVMNHANAVPVSELTQIRMHIKTLASIHDMLVRDIKAEGVPASLSVKAELHKLMPMLQEIVGPQRIEWKVEDIRLPIKHGMSLAVLVNELVCNAVKHGGHKVQLQVAMLAENVRLEVCDDGPGFAEAFDPKHSANYGLELVESVGRLDLGGHTSYTNRPEGGACVQVTFPLPLPQMALAS